MEVLKNETRQPDFSMNRHSKMIERKQIVPNINLSVFKNQKNRKVSNIN